MTTCCDGVFVLEGYAVLIDFYAIVCSGFLFGARKCHLQVPSCACPLSLAQPQQTSSSANALQDVLWQMGAIGPMKRARSRVEKNCFVGFVGEQNAGKSTLVHMLTDTEVSKMLLRLHMVTAK